MRKIWEKKEYIILGIVIILFIFVSIMSFSSIKQLQGNARVVNYVGIVRGATQKLIKEEIMGWEESQKNPNFAEESEWYPDDALVERLDSIIDELLTGEGSNDLVVLEDKDYLANMEKVQEHWVQLKVLIIEVRDGANPDELFYSSQEYFELVNDTVFSAETYSENQVNSAMSILMFVSGLFILLLVISLVFFIRSIAVRRRADVLGKLAYVDSLTKLDNRASCERFIENIRNEKDGTVLTVFMFDMNDLKLTNDFLGHKGGDMIIVEFAKALKSAVEDDGFIGRYGGDEFLAVFKCGDEVKAEKFLDRISALVEVYNSTQINKLEKIYYSVGYKIADTKDMDIDDIIHEADNAMYANKRLAKSMK